MVGLVSGNVRTSPEWRRNSLQSLSLLIACLPELGNRGRWWIITPQKRFEGIMTDTVATWDVSLPDGVHKIRFEHGTTTGKRVIFVDGVEVLRRNWMFRLVGHETFNVGTKKATVHIEAVSGFQYEYTLEVDSKPLKKFVENCKKTAKVWTFMLDGIGTRVVLEKDTMEVWANGNTVETAGEFVDDGTETHFYLGNHTCYIKTVSSGNKREGMIHCLMIDGNEIPPVAGDE